VLGGARGMAGAAMLARARRCSPAPGACSRPPSIPAWVSIRLQPEIMVRDAAGFDFSKRTVVAGPGMGDGPGAALLLAKVLDGDSPLVLDADALNLIAAGAELQERVRAHRGAVVMTPHPLEAARLLGVTAAIVQADRLENARELAQRFDAVVILKGAGSVIARPDGDVVINTSGNPGLASGGTGDVLAGLCGALLAQGWPAWEAALGGAWLHGRRPTAWWKRASARSG
jgi:hydroxyethylthiazole kinase-like uncharacterized protein yjeF